MATTTVKGKVSRVFFDGKGAEVTEVFQSRGEEVKKRWAIWFPTAHGLALDQEIEVSGVHSDKLEEYEKDGVTRHTVKRSINFPKILGQSASVSAAPADEPWNAAPTYESEAPF